MYFEVIHIEATLSYPKHLFFGQTLFTHSGMSCFRIQKRHNLHALARTAAKLGMGYKSNTG